MINKTNTNEKINELNYLRDELNNFVYDNFVFEIKQQGNYLFLGIKKGFSRLVCKKYKKAIVIKYLNLLEYGLNDGLVCEKCLRVGRFATDETGAFISKCLEHGSLI